MKCIQKIKYCVAFSSLMNLDLLLQSIPRSVDDARKLSDVSNDWLSKNVFIKSCAETVGVKPIVLASLTACAVILFLAVGVGIDFIALIISIGYPSYQSYLALKSDAPKDLKAWLRYWIVLALFTALQDIVDSFLSWIPLYSLVKIGFVIWLFYKQAAGASIIYNSFIEPNLNIYVPKVKSQIEAIINNKK